MLYCAQMALGLRNIGKPGVNRVTNIQPPPKRPRTPFEFPDEEGSFGPPRRRPVGFRFGMQIANVIRGLQVAFEFIALAYFSFVNSTDMAILRGPDGALGRMALGLGLITTVIVAAHVTVSGPSVASLAFLAWQSVRFLAWIGSW